MDYLNEDEIRRAKECVANIQDKLNAVSSEIQTREKPYKYYLKDKLDSIAWDVNCLLSMCKKEEEET